MRQYKVVCGRDTLMSDFEKELNDLAKDGYIIDKFQTNLAENRVIYYTVIMVRNQEVHEIEQEACKWLKSYKNILDHMEEDDWDLK